MESNEGAQAGLEHWDNFTKTFAPSDFSPTNAPHWGDLSLLYQVKVDMGAKNGWTCLHGVALDLPLMHNEGYGRDKDGAAETKTQVLGLGRGLEDCHCERGKAFGIIASVEEEVGSQPGEVVTKLVFPVNARLPLPTASFGDVVAAAEQHLRLCNPTARQGGEELPQGVMAAFCSGPSIIYYNVSSGINLS